MAPNGRRCLHPSPALDPLLLRSAFQHAGVKDVHMSTVWKHIIQSSAAVDFPKSDDETWSILEISRRGLPPVVSQVLKQNFTPCSTREHQWQSRNQRGSGKLILELQDGQQIETVIIEHGGTRPRSTVCVSSQVGCKMGCKFCATGTMGLRAQLTAGEILEQLMHARRRVRPEAPLRNVVFMGMGEPLDNYQQVIASLRVMCDACGFGLAMKNITVSTVGVPDRIVQLAHDYPSVKLALSLHAPTQDLRAHIVPSARGNSLNKIMEAVDEYCEVTSGSQVMMEYVLIEGTNASESNAHALGRLLASCRGVTILNLIPYNPTAIGDESGFRSPSNDKCKKFRDIVASYRRVRDAPGSQKSADARAGAPIVCTIRWSTTAGQRNNSACGQLALEMAARILPQATSVMSGAIKDVEDLSLNKCQESPLVAPITKRHELAEWMHWRSVRLIGAMSLLATFGFLVLRKSNRREHR